MDTNKIISRPEVNFWVPIMVAIVTASMSFAVLSNKVSNNELNIARTEAKIDTAVIKAENQFGENNKTLVDIQMSITAIQKDIVYIKEKVQ